MVTVCLISGHNCRLNVKGMFKKQIDTPVEEEEEEEEEREVTPLVPGHVTIMRREHRPNIQRDRAPLIEIVCSMCVTHYITRACMGEVVM